MVRLPVLVVGGGVSGLALAYRLHRRGLDFLLAEASERLGGNIRTEIHDGYLYDVGPDSFLRTRPEAFELARELGLEGEFVFPEATGGQVFVAHEGRLFPMPEGLSLGVPTRVSALLGTELLSDVGKLRAMCEPFVPRGSAADESILAFCERRLGREMATRIAAPLLSGVFAGDAGDLSMRAAFPQLVELERKFGSLFSGLNGGKSLLEVLRAPPKSHGSPFVSFRGGLERFVRALAEAIPASAIRLGTRVSGLERRGSVFAAWVGGASMSFSAVALAGPPFARRELLGTLSPKLVQETESVRGAPTATVFFGLEAARLERPLVGSGFIVPPGEGGILAATYVSSKWAGRAPEGSVLVRAFLGGARGVGPDLRTVSDEVLFRHAFHELERFTGPLGAPTFARAYRYPNGSPQPTLGHLERHSRIQAELERHPGLFLFGPGHGGVGIPDCVRQANLVADSLAALGIASSP